MAVQFIPTAVSMHYSSITCSHNTNGLCSHLHSQLFLHCHTACYFVIIVREAGYKLQSSLTVNEQELCPYQCTGRQ